MQGGRGIINPKNLGHGVPLASIGVKLQVDYEKELGNVAFRREDYTAALQHYDNAIEKAGSGATAALFSNKAAAFLKMANYDACIQQCLNSLSAPGLTLELKAKIFCRMASAHEAQGKVEKAMEALRNCEFTQAFLEKNSDLLRKLWSRNPAAMRAFCNNQMEQAASFGVDTTALSWFMDRMSSDPSTLLASLHTAQQGFSPCAAVPRVRKPVASKSLLEGRRDRLDCSLWSAGAEDPLLLNDYLPESLSGLIGQDFEAVASLVGHANKIHGAVLPMQEQGEFTCSEDFSYEAQQLKRLAAQYIGELAAAEGEDVPSVGFIHGCHSHPGAETIPSLQDLMHMRFYNARNMRQVILGKGSFSMVSLTQHGFDQLGLEVVASPEDMTVEFPLLGESLASVFGEPYADFAEQLPIVKAIIPQDGDSAGEYPKDTKFYRYHTFGDGTLRSYNGKCFVVDLRNDKKRTYFVDKVDVLAKKFPAWTCEVPPGEYDAGKLNKPIAFAE